MESKEINITYETLYEILKREKDLADLQKLDPNFFEEFVKYLNEKKSLLDKDDSLFSEDEKKKTEKQIDNAKRLIKDLYERREKKVMSIALTRSRTQSDIIDTSAFLEHERKLFDEAVKVLDSFRYGIINRVMKGEDPLLTSLGKETRETETGEENETSQTQETSKEQESGQGKDKDTKMVRFLHTVPKFVGKELEEYGPFDEEDVANLPSEIADLLIGKGRAEEIEGS